MVADQLWAQPEDGSPWMAGGSYLVSRRIRMTIETWDRTSLKEQEAIIGRHKGVRGAAGPGRRTRPDRLRRPRPDGQPVIPAAAHIRLAHPSHNGNMHLLRRGYNFADGVDRLGRMDAGLFFLAYQRDPRTQFVPIQTQLSRLDILNEYIKHGSSGLFACPPGSAPRATGGTRSCADAPHGRLARRGPRSRLCAVVHKRLECDGVGRTHQESAP